MRRDQETRQVTPFIAGQRPVTTLPGKAVPYVLEAGSGRANVLLGEVGRALVGAEESSGAMSVMTLDGHRAGRPIPLHYHDEEYEFFFCVRGAIQVWADDESRILTPGDFAYVPPGTLHAYQLHGHRSMFVGPIVPGGWDRFFDLTGTPYGDPLFPQGPSGPPPFEKFKQAEVEFKMKYRPDQGYAQASSDAADDSLPGSQTSFFLRGGEGTRHVYAGQLQTELVTAVQTEGKVAMTTVTMSKGPGLPKHVHEHTHEALFCLEGRVRVWLDGEEHVLTRGDCANVPAQTEHAYTGESHFTEVLTMSSPGGLERLIAGAGSPTDERVFAAQAEPIDLGALREAGVDVDVVFSDG